MMRMLRLPVWLSLPVRNSLGMMPDRYLLRRSGRLAMTCLMIAAVVGAASALRPVVALLAALSMFALGLVVTDLGLLPLLSIPATLVAVRVGGLLSVSDFVLAPAIVCAMLLISWRYAGQLRPLMWASGVYLISLTPGLLLNPYIANVSEWFHEIAMVMGGLVVGWVVGWQGRARIALSLYLLGCCLIGVWAVGWAVLNYAATGLWEPAYLPELHKNHIGNALALGFVMAFARPVWVGWSRRWSVVAMGVCAAGIAAAQSRQAMVGAAVGVAYLALSTRRVGLRSKIVLVASPALAWYVWGRVAEQIDSGNEYNSFYQRVSWFQESLQVWSQSPWLGVGLRWWYTDRFDEKFQPPNLEFEVLTSSGVLGLVTVLLMFVWSYLALRKGAPLYMSLAIAVLLTRFTQGQLDLFWVGGMSTLPWLVAGLCIGEQARSDARARPADDTTAPLAVSR